MQAPSGILYKHVPNIYSQMLIMAAMMLIEIINSSYSMYIDIGGGKRAFNTVLAMLRKASVENNDLRGRTSTILARLWGGHHSLTVRREQEPNVHIKTR
jgi:transcriptional regulatory protein LEU3